MYRLPHPSALLAPVAPSSQIGLVSIPTQPARPVTVQQIAQLQSEKARLEQRLRDLERTKLKAQKKIDAQLRDIQARDQTIGVLQAAIPSASGAEEKVALESPELTECKSELQRHLQSLAARDQSIDALLQRFSKLHDAVLQTYTSAAGVMPDDFQRIEEFQEADNVGAVATNIEKCTTNMANCINYMSSTMQGVESTREQIEFLQHEITEYSRMLSDQRLLQLQLNECQNALQTATEGVTRETAEKRLAEAALERERANTQALAAQVEACNARITEVREKAMTEVAAAISSRTSAELENASLKRELAKFGDIETALRTARDELVNARTHIASTERDCKAQALDLSNCKSKLTILKQQMETLRKEKGDLNSKIMQQEFQLERQQDTIRNCERQYQSRLEAVVGRAQETKTGRATGDLEIEKLKTQLNTSTQQHSKCKEDYAACREELAACRAALDLLKQDKATGQSEYKTKEDEIARLTAAEGRLKDTIAENNTKLQELRDDLKQARESCASTKKELSALQKRFKEQATTGQQSLSKQLQDALRDVELWKTRFEDRGKEVARLRDEVTDTKKHLRKLDTSLHSESGELNKCILELKQRERERDEARSKATKLSEEQKNTNDQLIAAQNDLRTCRSNLQRTKDQLTDAQAQLSSVTNEMNDCRRKLGTAEVEFLKQELQKQFGHMQVEQGAATAMQQIQQLQAMVIERNNLRNEDLSRIEQLSRELIVARGERDRVVEQLKVQIDLKQAEQISELQKYLRQISEHVGVVLLPINTVAERIIANIVSETETQEQVQEMEYEKAPAKINAAHCVEALTHFVKTSQSYASIWRQMIQETTEHVTLTTNGIQTLWPHGLEGPLKNLTQVYNEMLSGFLEQIGYAVEEALVAKMERLIRTYPSTLDDVNLQGAYNVYAENLWSYCADQLRAQQMKESITDAEIKGLHPTLQLQVALNKMRVLRMHVTPPAPAPLNKPNPLDGLAMYSNAARNFTELIEGYLAALQPEEKEELMEE